MMFNKSFLLCFLAAFAPVLLCFGFVGQKDLPRRSFVSKSSLSIGPLQKLTNKGEYEKVVSGLMKTKGYTREQAEKEYNSYLDNPTNYALNKGEEYYKSLGYKTLIEGVIGEAEKEGRGEEVRARIEKFQKQSKLKGMATITFFIVFLTWYNSVAPPVVLNGQ